MWLTYSSPSERALYVAEARREQAPLVPGVGRGGLDRVADRARLTFGDKRPHDPLRLR